MNFRLDIWNVHFAVNNKKKKKKKTEQPDQAMLMQGQLRKGAGSYAHSKYA